MAITYLDDEEGKEGKITYLDDTPTSTATAEQPRQQRPSLISQLVRLVMGTSPLEQLKTAQFTQEQIQQGKMNDKTFQGGIFTPSQDFKQQIQSREQGIVQQGTLAQLAPPMEAGLVMAGGVAPLQTAKFLGKMGILETLANASGLNKKIENIEQPEAKDIAEMSKFLAMGGLASKKWTPELVQNVGTRLAKNVIASLIRPTHKNWLFGKDPAGAIAKEGIVALSMEDLGNKVQQRIDVLKTESKTYRALPENMDKKVDLSKTIEPLRKVYGELAKAPETHKAEINKIEGIISDLTGGKDTNLNNLNVENAYQVKEVISKMQSWKVESEGSNQVNIALKETYHNVDAKIDKAIPQLEKLNSRMADLISAKTAIKHRIERLQNIDPVGWKGLIDLPFKAYRLTVSKTLLANLLSAKYPKK